MRNLKETTLKEAAVTFFVTMQEKSLANLGIKVDWTDLDSLSEQIENALEEADCDGCFAICKSAEGHYHCHAVVTFATTKRVKAVAKLLGCAHTEVLAGTKKEAEAYLRKEGKYAEKGEEVLKVVGDFKKIKDNKGKRNDLEAFDKEALKPDFVLNEYLLKHCSTLREEAYLEKRFVRLKNSFIPKEREVKVIYVEGKSRCGKTSIAYNCFDSIFKTSVDTKAQFLLDGYQFEKTLILDELRPNIFNDALLLQYLDRYEVRVNIKGGSIMANWDTVIITTAYPLDSWYRDVEYGKDNLREQFFSRIDEHYVTRRFKGFSLWVKYEDKDLPKEEILKKYENWPYKRFYPTKEENKIVPCSENVDNKTNLPFEEVEITLPNGITEKGKGGNANPIEDNRPPFVVEAEAKALLNKRLFAALFKDEEIEIDECDVYPYDMGIAVPKLSLAKALHKPPRLMERNVQSVLKKVELKKIE